MADGTLAQIVAMFIVKEPLNMTDPSQSSGGVHTTWTTGL